MPDGKNRNYQNTRTKSTKFVLFLRVVSCVFVVNSFFREYELTLPEITRSCSRMTKSARLG